MVRPQDLRDVPRRPEPPHLRDTIDRRVSRLLSKQRWGLVVTGVCCCITFVQVHQDDSQITRRQKRRRGIQGSEGIVVGTP